MLVAAEAVAVFLLLTSGLGLAPRSARVAVRRTLQVRIGLVDRGLEREHIEGDLGVRPPVLALGRTTAPQVWRCTMRHLRTAGLMLILSIGLVALGIGPAASSDRFTRGDAQAAMRAGIPGGHTIQTMTPTTAPDLGNYPAIWLFSLAEDLRVCTQDWRVLMFGWFVLGTHDQAVAERNLLDVSFAIDGLPVDSQATAIQRLAHPNFPITDPLWGWLYGSLIPPGSLSVGAHQLDTFLIFDGEGSLTVTFFVDAAGTGSCL